MWVLSGLAPTQGAPSVLRHFCCQFSTKIALVRCPSAFRLHRLAQTLHRNVLILGRGKFPGNFRVASTLHNVHMHFDCAGSHKLRVCCLAAGIFSGKCSQKVVLVRCPCALRLRRLAQSLQSDFSLILGCKGPPARITWKRHAWKQRRVDR